MNIRLNEALQTIAPSASMAINEKAKQLAAGGARVISLAAGEPDFDTPAAASQAGISAIRAGHTHYAPAAGHASLREKIAQKLQEENQIPCTAANILLTPGGKYAVYEAVRALITPGRGEEVLILNPAWVSYGPIVTASGGVPVPVELPFASNYRITRELLEAHVSKNSRALLINYPNNPTGCILSEEEAGLLADFVLAHDLVLISDEIYECIVYDGKKNVSPASLPQLCDRVITINGFSKSSAMTGWRLGYLCAPAPILKVISLLHQHTISCLSPFSMEAAEVALDCREELAHMVACYASRRALFVAGLNAIPGVTCHSPSGAFYAWAQVELPGMNSLQIADYLLEEAGVAVVPGAAYGLGGDRCIRMSFATSEEELREALHRMEAAIRRLL